MSIGGRYQFNVSFAVWTFSCPYIYNSGAYTCCVLVQLDEGLGGQNYQFTLMWSLLYWIIVGQQHKPEQEAAVEDLTSMASHWVMLMTAAFEAQYAAGIVNFAENHLARNDHTCCWPSHKSQLTCDIHNASPIPRSSIVSWEKILFEHLLDLCTRGQPAAAIVNVIDSVKGCSRSLMGSFIVA